MTTRIAIPLEGISGVCTLPNGNRMETSRAKTLGYTIASREAIAAAASADTAGPSPMKARIAYAEKIEALPEAKTRPSAAAAIYANHTADTMPLEIAAAFLRGLPEEKPVVTANDPGAPSADLLRRFQRKLEIRIAGLSVRADRGDSSARTQVTKLTMASSLRHRTGCSWGDALTNVGLDARVIISDLM